MATIKQKKTEEIVNKHIYIEINSGSVFIFRDHTL